MQAAACARPVQPNDLWRALCAPEVSFSALLTVRVCLACLALHALTAIPLARLGMTKKPLLRRMVNFVITLPLVFPPMAMGFLLLMLLGRNGWGGMALQQAFGVSLVFSQGGIILAAWLAGLPLVIKPVQTALANPDLLRFEQAARVCGASPRSCFFLVTLPLIRHGLGAGLLLGITRAMGEVGISLMLGGNIAGRTNTLSLEVFNAVSTGEFQRAALLCSILAIISLLLYLGIEWCQKRSF